MGTTLPAGLSVEAGANAGKSRWRPRNCVWEITLACNLRCGHCGSRAGVPRDDELNTAECLDVVAQLADLRCELVTLSGGEPTLRPDWDRIARALSNRGVLVNMVTNGVGIDRAMAGRAVDAGMCNVGVSLDGTEGVHDRIRGPGAFQRTMAGIEHFQAVGLSVGIMTTVNRLNLDGLETIRDLVRDLGVSSWRLQLGKPMGAMQEHDEWVIHPRQVLDLIPRLARMKKEGGITLNVGDSIGYYGPHDRTLRGWGWRGREERWQGCQAGLNAIGIESDGGVKGCLSMQAREGEHDPFIEGNLREASLADLWFRPGAFAYNREFCLDDLSGFCRHCSKALKCRGGAKCVSSAATGSMGEDPYCYHRIAAIESRPGLHKALTQGAAAASAALVLSVSGCWEEASGTDAGGPDVPFGTDSFVMDNVLHGPDVKDTSLPDPGTTDPGPPPKEVVEPKDVTDAIDCSQVCCMCEYGIIPDEVWNACCAPPPEDVIEPDPGENEDVVEDAPPFNCAAMQCFCNDEPVPEDVWKECCEVCAYSNCCDCDYGMSPPPQCCPDEWSCPEE